jgi:hypothetical protein
MARPRFESAETPLGRCEFWPTVLLLPTHVIPRLDELVRRAQGAGLEEPLTRAELVAGLVMRCGMTEPEDLVNLSRGRTSARRIPRSEGQDPVSVAARERLYLRLPSPVTWRLTRLVHRAQLTGERVTRAGIVTGLIWIAPTGASRLHGLARDGRTLLAGEAALDGEPADSVLALVRPRPGPTPRRVDQRPAQRQRRP